MTVNVICLNCPNPRARADTFRYGNCLAPGELRLVIIDVNDLDDDLGVARERRSSLICSSHSELVIISNFSVQNNVGLDDPRVLLVDGEGSVVIAVYYLIVKPLLLDTVRVHSHHLGDKRSLVVSLPGPSEVHLLSKARLVVVLVSDGDDALGVGVEVLMTSRLADDSQIILTFCLEVDLLMVGQTDQAIVGVNL